MSAFYWLLLGLSILYIVPCLYLYFRQQQIIFVPHLQLTNPVPANLSTPYESVSIPTADGQKLVGWWFPHNQPESKTVLFLHGNAGYTDFNFQTIQLLHEYGFSVLAFNYRGYGESPQKPFPSEQRVYEDAHAAYDFVCNTFKVQGHNLLLYGHSLGGAIAIELATHKPVAGLFLESTFVSMQEMSVTNPIYQIFPINWILHQRFDSHLKISCLHIPVFFCHGTADETVPDYMSPRLAAIANEPKLLKIVEGADHNNLPVVDLSTLRQGIEWMMQQTNMTMASKE